MFQEGQVGGFVMQWEDAVDVPPLAPTGSDASAAIGLWPVHQVVNRQDILGFECAVDNSIFRPTRMSLNDPVQPVLESEKPVVSRLTDEEKGGGLGIQTGNCIRSFPESFGEL
jgi:hypothetical protein